MVQGSKMDYKEAIDAHLAISILPGSLPADFGRNSMEWMGLVCRSGLPNSLGITALISTCQVFFAQHLWGMFRALDMPMSLENGDDHKKQKLF